VCRYFTLFGHTPSVSGGAERPHSSGSVRCDYFLYIIRMVRGRIKEKNEISFSRSKSRHRKGKQKCWYYGKKDISRNIVGIQRNLRKNLRRKQIWL
jgi:hypothetical protein